MKGETPMKTMLKELDEILYELDNRISLLEDINDVWIRDKGEFHMGIYQLIQVLEDERERILNKYIREEKYYED